MTDIWLCKDVESRQDHLRPLVSFIQLVSNALKTALSVPAHFALDNEGFAENNVSTVHGQRTLPPREK
jgi:hypothetical protein